MDVDFGGKKVCVQELQGYLGLGAISMPQRPYTTIPALFLQCLARESKNELSEQSYYPAYICDELWMPPPLNSGLWG